MGKYPLDADKAASLLPLWQGVLAQQQAKLADTKSGNMKVTWATRIVQTEKAIGKLKGVLMEQEQKDVLTVWEHLKENGGKVEVHHYKGENTLYIHLSYLKSKWVGVNVVDIMQTRGSQYDGQDMSECAKWVKQQRKEAQQA